MEIGVQEASGWLGVSERRVQALCQASHLPARRIASVWLIDSTHLPRARARSRPMSPRIAHALIDLISDPQASAAVLGIDAREASRLRVRLPALLADPDPASMLASWLAAADPAPTLLAANPDDLPALLREPRLVPSGISDPRANLSAAGEVEAWVRRSDLDSLTSDQMFAAAGLRNVRLHVSDAPPANPVPLGRLLADLAAHPGPHESAAVHRLLSANHRAQLRYSLQSLQGPCSTPTRPLECVHRTGTGHALHFAPSGSKPSTCCPMH